MVSSGVGVIATEEWSPSGTRTEISRDPKELQQDGLRDPKDGEALLMVLRFLGHRALATSTGKPQVQALGLLLRDCDLRRVTSFSDTPIASPGQHQATPTAQQSTWHSAQSK